MLIHELAPNPGKVKKAKRVGRGNASGSGNYCNRGMGGQKSRAGGSIPAFFEGGQTPLNRRLPKLRGFKVHPKLAHSYQPVNVVRVDADERVKAGEVTKIMLADLGYIGSLTDDVKLLGKGKLTKKINYVGVEAASAGALATVEAAGGTISLVGKTSE